MIKLACIMLALTATDEPAGVLAPMRVYHGIGRSVQIDVRPPESVQTPQLLVLDGASTIFEGPIDVEPGAVDLAAVMPAIWRLRETAYLQLMDGAEAIGTPLVLQPMLSRLVPMTEEAINPNGILYTRIVGWYDENDEAARAAAEGRAPPPREEAGADDVEVDEAPKDVALFLPADEAAAALAGQRLCTGLRIYPERDVQMQTSHGTMRLAMRPDMAPNTAWNFLRLCEGGFYDDVGFHRVVPMTRNGDPFVIQAGDPTGGGSGGPGYWLPLEPSALPHDFGVISMARDVDPDSAGSQFFICLSRAGTARLDGHYCAFGETVDGAETIRAIAEVELRDVEAGAPMTPPIIERAVLVPAPPRRPGFGRPDRPVSFVPEAEPAPPEPERVPR